MSDTAQAAPANPVRGEIDVPLGDPPRVYVLRPSYEAIVAIETQTGKGMMRLFRDACEGDMPLADLATICSECIRAQGRATNDKMMAGVAAERIGEMIVESEIGSSGVLGRISVLLGSAVCGDYTAAGELKAARTTASSEPPTTG